jgi:hypothetical protein
LGKGEIKMKKLFLDWPLYLAILMILMVSLCAIVSMLPSSDGKVESAGAVVSVEYIESTGWLLGGHPAQTIITTDKDVFIFRGMIAFRVGEIVVKVPTNGCFCIRRINNETCYYPE